MRPRAGKQYALAQGGSASLGSTQSKTSPTPTVVPATSSTTDSGGALPKQLNRSMAALLQKRMDKATPPPWTEEQRTALRTYTGGSYTQINKCARGTAPCDPMTKKLLDDIKSAMKPSTDDIVVYRNTNPAAFGLTSGADLKSYVGKIIGDEGVISTAIKQIGWPGKLQLTIDVPKGARIGWVQPISLHPSEDEMVIAPGTQYEVVEVIEPHDTFGSYKVRLRAIPGSDAQSRAEKQSSKELVNA